METIRIVGADRCPPGLKKAWHCNWRGRTAVRPYIILVIGLALCLPVHASVAQLKKANRLFVKGDYEKASKLYSDALIDQPHSSILHFNAGDAAYQMGDFDKAIREFETAAESAIPQLKAAAHYNRGNALVQQQQLAQAIEAYKQSLRINPQDEDAKYNLGVALQWQKNPPKQQPKSGGGQDKKQSKGGEGQKENKKSDEKSQAPREQMSREDAERLLSAAGAGEKKKSNQKAAKAGIPHPDEDW